MSHKDIKVLIVDDEDMERTTMRDILEEYGYSVQEAASGQEAIDKVKGGNLDIVILDTVLPDIDGFDVCRRIKGINESLPKVIINTGKVEAVDYKTAREAGSDRYVVKTSDFKEIFNAIEELANMIKE